MKFPSFHLLNYYNFTQKYQINGTYVSLQNELQAEVDSLKKLITEEREKLSGKRGVPFTSVKGTVLSPLDTQRTFGLIRIFPIRCLRYLNSD